MTFLRTLFFCLLPLLLVACQTAQWDPVTNSFVDVPLLQNTKISQNTRVSAPESLLATSTAGPIDSAADETIAASAVGLIADEEQPRAIAAINEAAHRPTRQSPALKPAFGSLKEAAKGKVQVASTQQASNHKIVKKKKSRRKNNRITVAEGRRLYGAMIAKHARANGVPVKLAMAVVQVESTFRRNARGAVGEIGLMQLRPQTARYIGYRGAMKKLYDPDTNLRYGMKYLGKANRLGKGNLCRVILKYNAGHGAKRMNKVSARYCKRIRRIMRTI